MVEKVLKKYICNLKIQDIHDFAVKNGVKLSNDEAWIIYEYIQNDWETIVFGDETIVLNKIKNNISEETYNKIVELTTYFKQKYRRYL